MSYEAKSLIVYDRKSLSVEQNGKLFFVVKENNDAYCLTTDKVVLEWRQITDVKDCPLLTDYQIPSNFVSIA